MSIFTKVKAPKLPSSVFNLSHEAKLSCNMGDLVPILCQEILPGDKFKVSTGKDLLAKDRDKVTHIAGQFRLMGEVKDG